MGATTVALQAAQVLTGYIPDDEHPGKRLPLKYPDDRTLSTAKGSTPVDVGRTFITVGLYIREAWGRVISGSTAKRMPSAGRNPDHIRVGSSIRTSVFRPSATHATCNTNTQEPAKVRYTAGAVRLY